MAKAIATEVPACHCGGRWQSTRVIHRDYDLEADGWAYQGDEEVKRTYYCENDHEPTPEILAILNGIDSEGGDIA